MSRKLSKQPTYHEVAKMVTGDNTKPTTPAEISRQRGLRMLDYMLTAYGIMPGMVSNILKGDARKRLGRTFAKVYKMEGKTNVQKAVLRNALKDLKKLPQEALDEIQDVTYLPWWDFRSMGVRGSFNRATRTVKLNPIQVVENPNTFAHEVIHGVNNLELTTNDKLFKKITDAAIIKGLGSKLYKKLPTELLANRVSSTLPKSGSLSDFANAYIREQKIIADSLRRTAPNVYNKFIEEVK